MKMSETVDRLRMRAGKMVSDMRVLVSQWVTANEMAAFDPMELPNDGVIGELPDMTIACFADKSRSIIAFISLNYTGDYQVSILVPLPGKRGRKYITLHRVSDIDEMKTAVKIMKRICRSMPMTFGLVEYMPPWMEPKYASEEQESKDRYVRGMIFDDREMVDLFAMD